MIITLIIIPSLILFFFGLYNVMQGTDGVDLDRVLFGFFSMIVSAVLFSQVFYL